MAELGVSGSVVAAVVDIDIIYVVPGDADGIMGSVIRRRLVRTCDVPGGRTSRES